jgi:hypothetical protein
MSSGGASLAYRSSRTYDVPMCSYCGSPMPSDRPIGFGETCESCAKDLHACANCRFYKPGARWDCAETVEAPVPDKESRNFCDYFQTNPAFFSATKGRESARQAAEKARSDLDRLFGG